MKHVVFILASISQPRCHKRIQAFINAGYEVTVYGFDRSAYSETAFKYPYKINIIGNLKDGNRGLYRFFNGSKQIRKIIAKYDSHTLFYLFGFEIAIHAAILTNRYIYEISDMIYTYIRFPLISKVCRLIDRFLINRSMLTVVTSGGFKDYLFKDKGSSKVLIIPNKVNPQILNYPYKQNQPNIRSLKFGYVGAFRYPNTVFRFAEIIGANYPQHSFHFFGDSSYTYLAKDLADKYSNIIYHGVFKNPEDLANIYEQIDVVMAAYDTSTFNEKIAEPNKLYEALYFQKPIIVSPNTYLAKRVMDLKAGFVVDCSDNNSIVNFVDQITAEVLCDITCNIAMLETEDSLDDSSIVINKLSN